MLSALLGAICAASLAFAPVSASASVNADSTPTVYSAYYDSSAVADYGTEEGRIYNYTNTTFGTVDNMIDDFAPNQDEDFALNYNNTHTGLEISASNPDEGDGNLTNEENLEIDLYLNGEYYNTYSGTERTGYYEFQLVISLDYDNWGGYVWIFDHQGYQFGTDTVADIAEGLTSGIGTVATGIGGGLQSLMQNIFLVGTVDDETGAFTATGLSTFGIVTLVFCGLALALGLSRWIVGFASSLGSRNR